jgi:hypothetical protein
MLARGREPSMSDGKSRSGQFAKISLFYFCHLN